jgi:hypothetical protein
MCFHGAIWSLLRTTMASEQSAIQCAVVVDRSRARTETRRKRETQTLRERESCSNVFGVHCGYNGVRRVRERERERGVKNRDKEIELWQRVWSPWRGQWSFEESQS